MYKAVAAVQHRNQPQMVMDKVSATTAAVHVGSDVHHLLQQPDTKNFSYNFGPCLNMLPFILLALLTLLCMSREI